MRIWRASTGSDKSANKASSLWEATWARQTIELTFVIQTLKNLSAPPRMGNARTAYRYKDCASRI